MDELEINELDSVDGFFDDYEPTSEVSEPTEESADTSEPTDVVEETAYEEPVDGAENAPATEENVQNDFLKVKFNGEETALTEEEARVLAQKGMNYDRFYEPLEKLARMNNMSVGDYINQLNDTQVQYEVEKEKDNLRNDPKYENLDDEILDEIAQSRVKDFMGQREKYYADQDKQKADEEQAKAQREIQHFFEEYPEFKDKSPDALDPKVFELVGQGYTLLEAYNKFQRMNVQKSQAEAKAKVSKLNEENKKKSLGNTTNAGSGETDSFMDGFLNG